MFTGDYKFMNLVGIVIICVLSVVVSILLFFILKNIFMPKKVEIIPRLLKQGKVQNAIKAAKQIISKNQKNYLAHYYLGKAYLKENKPELAIIEYKIVNENALFGEGIDEISFRSEYADLLLKYNHNNEALKNYLLLTKMAPTNAEHFYNTGRLYMLGNRYDLALGFMQKATILNKHHAKAHAEIGLIQYRMKNFAEARKEIDIAIKLSPETYSSYYYLGKIQKDSKDLGAAIKSFEKAQRAPEMKVKAIIEHGSCYMIANRFDNAAVDFQRAIELDKDSLNQETLYARYFLASCYEAVRKIDKALEQWEIIFEKNKGFKDVGAKINEYKDLQANDHLKEYLTCPNDDFIEICKKATENGLKYQILSCDIKKWGCQITAVDKKDEAWMNVRKQVFFFRFYRESTPLPETVVHESLDAMKKLNSVKGFIFSSSGYSNAAKKFAENRPIELVDKQKLEKLLSISANK